MTYASKIKRDKLGQRAYILTLLHKSVLFLLFYQKSYPVIQSTYSVHPSAPLYASIDVVGT